jgi:hypothetical protein
VRHAGGRFASERSDERRAAEHSSAGSWLGLKPDLVLRRFASDKVVGPERAPGLEPDPDGSAAAI